MSTLETKSRAVAHKKLDRLVACSKISEDHLDRLAVVYLRQSSPHQVIQHPESTARQYAFADRAVEYGWSQDRVLVIDEDLGRSSTNGENRTGFQRLLGLVTAGQVGAAFGLELSRLARVSREWHHLFEMSAVFGSLLIDEDGVYDPNHVNDRLVLGLKGMLSEMELHMMKSRLERGRLNKAQRGELFHDIATGYVLVSHKVELDPDEQVRSAIHHFFDKFDDLGSAHSVYRDLVRTQTRLPFRRNKRDVQGQIDWRLPSYATVYDMLRNPIYAGTYAYGWKHKYRKRIAGRNRVRHKYLPMEEWKAVLPDHLPAYITWKRYLKNQERLRQNRSWPDSPGPPREGSTLLGGLVVCGNCDGRMYISCSSAEASYYHCNGYLKIETDTTCHAVQTKYIDELVAQQLLVALEPASLELSLQVVGDVERERKRQSECFQQALERARYECQRAERQYMAVEPENRLVARTLEQRWEEALSKERDLREEYDRFLREQPTRLTDEAREHLLSLASDVPALWKSEKTTMKDRQEIVRCLVEQVVLRPQGNSERVDVTIHWAGGFQSEHEVLRPVGRYEQLHDFDRIIAMVVDLRRRGLHSAEIADKLNAEGYSTAQMRPFNEGNVWALVGRKVVREQINDRRLGPHEWNVGDLASELSGMSTKKLKEWVRCGWATAVQRPVAGPWILWADEEELARLQELAACSASGVRRHPLDLTTPKQPSCGS
jgi:DNA invertase Pin-like site-specific DNA recombinase